MRKSCVPMPTRFAFKSRNIADAASSKGRTLIKRKLLSISINDVRIKNHQHDGFTSLRPLGAWPGACERLVLAISRARTRRLDSVLSRGQPARKTDCRPDFRPEIPTHRPQRLKVLSSTAGLRLRAERLVLRGQSVRSFRGGRCVVLSWQRLFWWGFVIENYRATVCRLRRAVATRNKTTIRASIAREPHGRFGLQAPFSTSTAACRRSSTCPLRSPLR